MAAHTFPTFTSCGTSRRSHIRNFRITAAAAATAFYTYLSYYPSLVTTFLAQLESLARMVQLQWFLGCDLRTRPLGSRDFRFAFYFLQYFSVLRTVQQRSAGLHSTTWLPGWVEVPPTIQAAR